MQAITLAIGKQGISFFTQHYLLPHIQAALATLSPPDRSINLPDFQASGGKDISRLNLTLSGGKLVDYAPVFDQVTQEMDAGNTVFKLLMGSNSFNAQYYWTESYHWDLYTSINGHTVHVDGDESDPFTYKPGFFQLLITILFEFLLDKGANAWELKVSAASGQPQGFQDNIPKDSILEAQLSTDCKGSHVIDCTKLMLDNVDIVSSINNLLSGIIQSIPGSGKIGNDIVYDFSTGDSGVVFPNNKGIQIGVKGGASYQEASFPPDTGKPLALPLPPGDDDAHHLVMYVSNYEVDALNWAFFKADKLNAVVNADDLKNDSYVLKVKTYVQSCPELKPYSTRAMQAQITPHAAPTTSFQVVYQLTAAVMAALKSSGSLPTDTYNNLNGLQGNNYVSVESLETDLSASGIEQKYFSTIEQAARNMGMVVTHNIDYTLIIQDFQPTQPTIVFNVQRTDILSNPALGLGGDKNQAQTLQFDFINVSWASTFVSSSIPKLNAAAFSGLWLNAGEPQYDKLMADLGKNGVPLPIMSGFQFDFDNAQVSVQENYISILANVMYK